MKSIYKINENQDNSKKLNNPHQPGKNISPNEHQLESAARSFLNYKSSKKSGQRNNFNSISTLLKQPKSELKKLLDSINEDLSTQKKVLLSCPMPLHPFILNSHLSNNRLIVLVDNGSAATQLRYLKTDLLNKLRNLGCWEIATIDIKVCPRDSLADSMR